VTSAPARVDGFAGAIAWGMLSGAGGGARGRGSRLVRWTAADGRPVPVEPMGCSGRLIGVSLVGSLANACELARELERRDHALKGGSEAEIVAHAYEQWGERCIERLCGMFALALLDEQSRVLLLARDRAGTRSLYYREAEGVLAFASSLTSLRESAAGPFDVDPQAIDAYLAFRAVPAPLSIYRSVKKLPAAHVLTVADGTARVRRYWSLDFVRKDRIGLNEAMERLEELLREVVAQTVRDRSWGLLLSGGLDSSILLDLLSTRSPEPVQTFTFAFSDDSPDPETAGQVASHFGAVSRVFRVDPRIAQDLPHIVGRYEQPYANPSALTIQYLEPVRQTQTDIVLTGEGADETFSGRERHLAAALVGRLHRVPGGRLVATVGAHLPLRRMRLVLEGVTLSAADRQLRWMSTFDEGEKARLYTSEFLARIDLQYPRHLIDGLIRAATHPVDQMFAADFGLWIPEVLWPNLDPGAGAAGVEQRAPFLDHRVVEFALRLPPALRVGWIRSKRLLRELGRRRRIPVQAPLLRKPVPKIPLPPLLRGDLRPLLEESLLGAEAVKRGYFRPEAVRRLVEEHLTGRADRSTQLFALLMLEQWHCRWLGR